MQETESFEQSHSIFKALRAANNWIFIPRRHFFSSYQKNTFLKSHSSLILYSRKLTQFYENVFSFWKTNAYIRVWKSAHRFHYFKFKMHKITCNGDSWEQWMPCVNCMLQSLSTLFVTWSWREKMKVSLGNVPGNSKTKLAVFMSLGIQKNPNGKNRWINTIYS